MEKFRRAVPLLGLFTLLLAAFGIWGCGGGGDSGVVYVPTTTGPMITGQVLSSVAGLQAVSVREDVRAQGAGFPVASADVYLESNSGVFGTTGPDGSFSIGPVPEGTYRVVARFRTKDGKLYKQISDYFTTPGNGSPGMVGSILLVEATSYAVGQLFDTDGKPAPFVQMKVWGETITSDANGYFTTPGMPASVTAPMTVLSPAFSGNAPLLFFPPLPPGSTFSPISYILTLVKSGAINFPPFVSLTTDKTTVDAGTQVNLVASATDLEGEALTYAWSAVIASNPIALTLGAGNLTAQFAAPQIDGIASVTLEVTDPKGLKGKASVGIKVNFIDKTAPTLAAANPLSPANGATNVSTATVLTMTFNEPVQLGASGVITIRRQSDGAIVEQLDIAVPAQAARVSINGAVATVVLSGNLKADGNSYYVNVANNVIRDLSGNLFAGILANTAWVFSCGDVVGPQLAAANALVPANGTVNIPGPNTLVMNFDQNVAKGTAGVIAVRRIADDSVVQQFDMAVPAQAASVTCNAAQVTINLANALPETGAGFYVTVAANAIRDLSGLGFLGWTDKLSWTFTCRDTTAPVLVTTNPLNPVNGATNVPVRPPLIMSFSEGVALGTSGSITVRLASNNTVVEQFNLPADAAKITVAGSIVTIQLSQDLSGAGAGYYVTVSGGAIRDLSGNAYAGFTATNAWAFTTGDVQPPALAAANPLVPSTGSLGVASNVALVMNFSEPVTKIGTGVIQIRKLSDDSVQQTVAMANVTVAGSQATIQPPVKLSDDGLGYYVTVAAGSFVDATGLPFAGFSDRNTWNFTCSDLQSPVLVTTGALNPANGATNVPVNTQFVMTFNEAVKHGTGIITVKKSTDNSTVTQIDLGVSTAPVTITGTIVTMQFPVALPGDGGQYYLSVPAGAIKDIAGNNFVGITTTNGWVIRTVDIIAPTLAATPFTPASGAVGIASNTQLVMNFSETIVLGTIGKITVRRKSDDSLVTVLDVATDSAKIAVAGTQVTMTLPAKLIADGNPEYVTVQAGCFKDTAGNSFAGFIDNTTWVFTTLDQTPPVLATVAPFNPVSGAVQVATDANLIVWFNENVQLGNTGKIQIRGRLDNALFEEFDMASSTQKARVSVAGTQVTINPSIPFPTDGSEFSVLIGAGVVLDIPNNAFVGITDSSIWTFRPIDLVAPVTSVAFTPANGTRGVAVDTDLTIDFGEPMLKANSGVINIYRRGTTDTVFEAFDLSNTAQSARITVVNRKVTIDTTNALANDGGEYYVLIPSGALTDTAGNPYAGVTSSATWAFRTIDQVGPTVTLQAGIGPVIQDSNTVNFIASFVEADAIATSAPFAAPTIQFGASAPVAMNPTGSNLAWTYSWDVPAGCDGTTTVTIVANDLSGNANAAATGSNTFLIDNTGPAVVVGDGRAIPLVKPGDIITTLATFTEIDQIDETTPPTIQIGTVVNVVNMTKIDNKHWQHTWTVPNVVTASHAVTIVARDRLGHANSAATGRIEYGIDNTIPTVALTDDHADALVKKNDVVNFTATFVENDYINEATPPKISISGIGTNLAMAKTSNLVWTYAWTVPSGSDGLATITIAATDRVGNANATATGKILYRIDNSSPTVVVSSNDADGIVRSGNNVTITALFTDADQIDETPVPTISIGGIVTNANMTKVTNATWTYNWAVPAGNDGVATIAIVATDRVGNGCASPTGLTSFLVDNIAPTVVMSDNHPDAVVKQGNAVKFTATFTDADQINTTTPPQITIGAAPAANMTMTSNKVWTYDWTAPAGNGALAITITATDRAGNANAAATGKVAYTLDNTAPTVGLGDNQIDHVVRLGNVVNIIATFTEANALQSSPVPTITIGSVVTAQAMTQVDNLHWTYAWTVPAGNTGTQPVSIIASDVAGNANAAPTGSTSYYIDNSSPTVVLSDDQADVIVENPTAVHITAAFTETDMIDETTVPAITIGTQVVGAAMTKVDNTHWTYTWNVAFGKNGSAPVIITAKDRAGNTNATATGRIEYLINNPPPTVSLADDHADTIVRNGDTVNVTATFVAGGGISEAPTVPLITIAAAGITNQPMTKTNNLVWTYSWVVPAGVDGPATFTINATDTWGNGNDPATGKVSYTIDNTRPALTFSDNQTDQFVRDPDTVNITATFVEANNVDETTPPTITIAGGGVLNAAMTKTSNLIWTYSWNVPAGTALATVTVVAHDVAGNLTASPTAGRFQYVVDNELPTVGIGDNHPDAIVKQGNIVHFIATFTDFDQINEVTAPTITIGTLVSGQTMTKTDNLHWYYDWTVPAGNGSAGVWIGCTDRAGNANATTTGKIVYTLDNTVPTVALTNNLASNVVQLGDVATITATFTENDQIDEVTSPTIKIGALAPVTMTKVSNLVWRYVWTVPTGNDGTNNITITATDRAGNANTAPTGSTSFVIDNTGPAVVLSDNAPSVVVVATDSILITATLTDLSAIDATPASAPRITIGTQVLNQAMTMVDNTHWTYTWKVNTGVGSIPVSILAYDAFGHVNSAATGRTEFYLHMRRTEAATAVIGNKIYVFGGSNTEGTQTPVSSAEVYDTDTGLWSLVASMPGGARWGMAAAVSGTNIYVVGGSVDNTSYNVTGRLEVYDTSLKSWSTKTAMTTARFIPGAAVLNGNIYVAGGQDLNQVDLNVVEAYNITGNSWTTKKFMPGSGLGPNMAVVNGILYCVGAIQSQSVFQYDEGTNLWSLKTDLAHGLGLCPLGVYNNKVYLLGGVGIDPLSGANSVIQIYDPSTGTTDSTRSLAATRGWAGGGLGTVGGATRIFAVEGTTTGAAVEAVTP